MVFPSPIGWGRPLPWLVDSRLFLAHFIVMTITLAKDVEEFLQEQVRTGVCTDASELANDVLRSIREQQSKAMSITPELEAWLLESADKPSTPLTKSNFDGIRQRVLARINASTTRTTARRVISLST